MAKNLYKCDCSVLHKDLLAISKQEMIKEKQFKEVVKFTETIGNPTRLKILWALKATPLCVGDLANVLSMTKSAISHQLKILKDNFLVKCEKQGKEVFYCFYDDQIKLILDMIAIHVMELN